MQRIMIIGPGSTGKSTLARALGALSSLPVYHLDQHYWLPNWTPRSPEDWHSAHKKLAGLDQWIIDGDFPELLMQRLDRADCVIFLDLPRRVIIPAWIKRMYHYRGTNRPDMTAVNVERFNWRYLQWQLTYNRRAIRRLLTQYTAKKHVIVLRSRPEIEAFLAQFELVA